MILADYNRLELLNLGVGQAKVAEHVAAAVDQFHIVSRSF